MHWWHRIFVGAPTFKRIATFNDLAVDVACLARDTCNAFETVEERFHFVISDRIVAKKHIFRDDLLAPVFKNMRTKTQFFCLRTPVQAVPVRTGTADTIARKKRTETAIRQGDFTVSAAYSDRLLAGALHHLETHTIFQLIDHVRIFEIRNSVLIVTPLKSNDFKTFLSQFHCKNRAGPAEANNDHVFFLFLTCHVKPSRP